jgi:hypothetical protein
MYVLTDKKPEDIEVGEQVLAYGSVWRVDRKGPGALSIKTLEPRGWTTDRMHIPFTGEES